jgi:flagellar assembly protein FliH
MQSSYNVIKNNSVKNTGLREIFTSAETVAIKSEKEANIKENIESYESLARTIMENARRYSEQIKIKAYEEARTLEESALIKAEQLKKEAYEKGYEEGYEEGHNKAYAETMKQTKIKSEAIIASADRVLTDAKVEYEEYLIRKSKDINNLILSIATTVLKKEVEDKSSINAMIYEALESFKNARNFIIRCNGAYVEELKVQTTSWKEQLGFLGDIFVINDNSIELGNAIIDKGNGKVIVGIDYALQRIKDILEGRD